MRAEEMAKTRRAKLQSIEKYIEKKNSYLRDHPKASVLKALDAAKGKLGKLRLAGWAQIKDEARTLKIQSNEEAFKEESYLDGCYVIKTDLKENEANADLVHDRYKDLSEVEKVFRECKTVNLEVRPVYVRKEESTRGHVFVVMLAYLTTRSLRDGGRRSRTIGDHLFNENEGERPKGALSEDTASTATITRIIRGIADKVAGGTTKPEPTSSHEKKTSCSP